MPPSRQYRPHLQAAVANSASSYGYTLAIWTSGAVMTHSRGIPSGFEAILFLLGAVAGFAAVGAVAHGTLSGVMKPPNARQVRLWGGFHLLSAGLAAGGAIMIAALIHSPVAWPIDGFVVTSIYLSGLAAQFTIAEQRGIPETEIKRR